jgi:hypothetical protein
MFCVLTTEGWIGLSIEPHQEHRSYEEDMYVERVGERGERGRLEKRRGKREDQLHPSFNVNGGGRKLGGEWERDA